MKYPEETQAMVRRAMDEAEQKYGPHPENTDDEWLRILIEEIHETGQLVDNNGVTPETDAQMEQELAQIISTSTRWLTHRTPNVPEEPAEPPTGWNLTAQQMSAQQSERALIKLARQLPDTGWPKRHLARNPHTQAAHAAQQALSLIRAVRKILQTGEPLDPDGWRSLNRL